MSIRQFHFVLILFLIVISIFGCNSYPPSDFYEVDGLVSGSFTASGNHPGWQSIQYINSTGLVFTSDSIAETSPLKATVYFSTPGNYSFWTLTTLGVDDKSPSTLDVSVVGPKGFLISQAKTDLTDAQRLEWVMGKTDASTNLIPIDEPGQYTFSIRPTRSERVQVHKIQLSRNNVVRPSGLGLPLSNRTDLNAAELFRELPVMLPPAWVFKPVVGITGGLNSLSGGAINSSGIHGQAGGIWIDNGADDRSGQFAQPGMATGIRSYTEKNCLMSKAMPIFESGYRFIVTHGSPGVECLKRIHQAYQSMYGSDQRSVLFHGIQNAYNSDLKQYPAPMMPNYKFEWTAEPEVDDEEFTPGGYKELVGTLSNPANSLYGMPFLSMPIDYQSGTAGRSEWDSELFIRTIQLSPFLPVMHLMLPDSLMGEEGFFDQLDSLEKDQLFDAFQLRTSLFPYHYTHAHYTRQTNESVISGFREYPSQFLYGDAFLAAPVTEQNKNGRIVYFPEGRRWYNYYSGQAYEAGQSWFVETRLDRLPLFVKAGSVIPYDIKENSDRLKIEVYTGDAGAFRLVEDDGMTRAYRRAEAARTMFRYNEVEGNLKLTIGAVQSAFDGMKDRRSYDIYFKFMETPERVEINGRELSRTTGESEQMSWQYSDQDRETIINLNDISKHEKLDIIIYP